mgnify:CR=1 FL=1
MVTEPKAIENTEDILDVRDIIARFEFLEAGEDVDDGPESEDQQELAKLKDLLAALKGNGGDEEWRGDGYPITLIRETYFTEYAQELAEDIGAIGHELQWPLAYIDWEAAASQLKMDYTEVDFDGVTYLTR